VVENLFTCVHEKEEKHKAYPSVWTCVHCRLEGARLLVRGWLVPDSCGGMQASPGGASERTWGLNHADSLLAGTCFWGATLDQHRRLFQRQDVTFDIKLLNLYSIEELWCGL
jgi:hypothetical protein